MNGSFENFDYTTLLFLALAVVIFLRLRSVLGRRTGHERPPFDPSQSRSEDKTVYEKDNVVQLPKGKQKEAETGYDEATDTVSEKIRDFAAEGSSLAQGLSAIIQKDRTFDPKSFLVGAKAAYEMIVMAFNEGDRAALKPLLSSEVYESFSEAISDREGRGEVVEASFIGIEKAVITDAELRGPEALVTIRFVSKLISAVRNRDGEVINGDPRKIVEVTDIWTFSRNVTSKDPNWKLVGTESAD